MVSRVIKKIDGYPLWIMVFFLAVIVFTPYFIMGGGAVFPWNDQLDEDILNYVIPARHFGERLSTYSEMMTDMSTTALAPFAVMFVPFYVLFDFEMAFILQYLFVFLIAYIGMYLCVYKFTSSNILACITAAFFSMLPLWPVYGVTLAGCPIGIYAVICLKEKKKTALAYFLLAIVGISVNLMQVGYAFLALWALEIIWCLVRRKSIAEEIIGFFALIFEYVIVNYKMVIEVLFKTDNYVSHREEFVLYSTDFVNTFWDTLINGTQHSSAQNKYLIIPILLLIAYEGIVYKKLSERSKKLYRMAILNAVIIILIALFTAFIHCEPVVGIRNGMSGVFHTFQIDRFNWLYPTLWWLEIGITVGIVWDTNGKKCLISLLVLAVAFLPSFKYVVVNSYFYMSVNQITGAAPTWYIPWDSYYSQDLMEEIDAAIGMDKSTYRVAHLGINPTPSLVYGFYTIDGYAAIYPVEYKHKFREIIASELEKNKDVATYFDEYGSRCYLFNSQSGTSFMVDKDSNVKYKDLDFDWNAMGEMNCRFIFSGGEIEDYEECGLKHIGTYETDTSYWRIWVYELCDDE